MVVTFRPRTTSERRTSVAVVLSSCMLTTDPPGNGGKLDAARSNLGAGGLASIAGPDLCFFTIGVKMQNDKTLETKLKLKRTVLTDSEKEEIC